MKKDIVEKENHSVFSIVVTIIKIICVIILIALIVVLALQRFSNNQVAVGGFRVFNVATESMVPKYVVGDVLIVKETDINTLSEGDDVTYLGKEGTFSGRVVTHQIVKIEESENGRVFHTKGVANNTEDPLITGEQIYGKVVYKCILISLLTKLMNNMTAFYIIFFIPFAILIFLQIKDSLERKSDNDDEDEEEYDEEDDDDGEEDYDDNDDDSDEIDEE